MQEHVRGQRAGYPNGVGVPESDLLAFERPLVSRGEVVVGVDEVGRGALAGPVTVGALVITSDAQPPAGLNDSKLLTRSQRERLVEPLQEWATDWSLGSASAREIDEWGLRLALAIAATRALDGLKVRPTYALLDGSFNLLDAPMSFGFATTMAPELSYARLPCTTLIKGDRRSASIAGAAVLAKVARDRTMREMSEHFPQFEWGSNKGYGATVHLEALRRHGPTVEHRKTWKLPASSGPEAL